MRVLLRALNVNSTHARDTSVVVVTQRDLLFKCRGRAPVKEIGRVLANPTVDAEVKPAS